MTIPSLPIACGLRRFALAGFVLAIVPATFTRADDPQPAAPSAQDAAVEYATQIKPLLAARCVACHGPLRQQQGLRLDTAAAIRQGGESGPAIEPHHGRESLLVRAVTGADGYRMPPEGEPLSADEIARLARSRFRLRRVPGCCGASTSI